MSRIGEISSWETTHLKLLLLQLPTSMSQSEVLPGNWIGKLLVPPISTSARGEGRFGR